MNIKVSYIYSSVMLITGFMLLDMYKAAGVVAIILAAFGFLVTFQPNKK